MNKENQLPEITKTTVECYKIRHPYWWADITIDAKGHTGRIQIASAYGSWQNYWGACGESFKKFLTGLDMHYVAGKFGCSNWFDMYKTIAEFKHTIKSNFDNGYLDLDQYEEALTETDSLEHESSCKEDFCMNLKDCSQIMRLYDHCPELIYGVEPSFEKFWKTIWPMFIETIKKEQP